MPIFSKQNQRKWFFYLEKNWTNFFRKIFETKSKEKLKKNVFWKTFPNLDTEFFLEHNQRKNTKLGGVSRRRMRRSQLKLWGVVADSIEIICRRLNIKTRVWLPLPLDLIYFPSIFRMNSVPVLQHFGTARTRNLPVPTFQMIPSSVLFPYHCFQIQTVLRTIYVPVLDYGYGKSTESVIVHPGMPSKNKINSQKPKTNTEELQRNSQRHNSKL